MYTCRALLDDIKNGKINPSEQFLSILSPYFDWAGMNNPLHKIYITSKSSNEYGPTFFFFVMAHLQKIYFLKPPGTSLNKVLFVNFMNLILGNAKRGQDHLDGVPFIVSIHTILKQFHPSVNETFIQSMVQFTIQVTKQSIG